MPVTSLVQVRRLRALVRTRHTAPGGQTVDTVVLSDGRVLRCAGAGGKGAAREMDLWLLWLRIE